MMEKLMKRFLTVALLATTSLMAAAQVKVDLNEAYPGGTVTASQGEPDAEGNVVVTLTVTPDEGYTIAKSDITVVLTLPSESVSTRDGDPSITEPLALGGDDPEDLAATRDYTFTVASGFGAWVREAVFHKAEPSNDISGEGSDVAWTYDADAKQLVISGKGVTMDFGGEAKDPWAAIRDQIEVVVVEKEITGLGANIFQGCTALKSIRIMNAESAVALGDQAIPAIEGLQINVPGNLYNEYLSAEGWGSLPVDSEEKVQLNGISFSVENQYDTFVSESDLIVPSVLQAYIIDGINGDGLSLREVSVIQAGVPVLVFSKAGEAGDFFTAPAEPSRASAASLLKVAPAGGQEVKLGEAYLLYNDVFYYAQAGTIPEGRIYLSAASVPEKTRSFYSLTGDGTTAIAAQRIADATEVETWYTLDGRRLNAAPSRKGLYINNGKKVVIK